MKEYAFGIEDTPLVFGIGSGSSNMTGDDQGLDYLGVHGDGIGAEMTGP